MVAEIFRYLIEDNNPRTFAYAKWFSANLPLNTFEDLEYILASLIVRNIDLGITLSQENLQDIIYLNLKELIAESNAKVPETRDLNYKDPIDLAKAFEIIKQLVLAEVELLHDNIPYNEADFPNVVRKYFEERKAKALYDTLSIANTILSVGWNGHVGANAAHAYAQRRLTEISTIYSDEKIKILTENAAVEFTPEIICSTHIQSIDQEMYGIMTGQLWGVEADGGVGKTRMALGVFTYYTLLAKKNVVYCAMEQSVWEIKSMLIARHVLTLYKVHVSSTDIYYKKVPDNLKEFVSVAEYDLFESGNYGTLYIYTEQLYDNTFCDIFTSIDQLKGPFQLWIIDHMYLLEHRYEKGDYKIPRHEIISNGYRNFKRFVANKTRAGLALNQLNKEGSAAVKADKCPDQDGAAGGKEVYRNTDFNIVINQTETMKAQNVMRAFFPKVRFARGDQTPLMSVSLADCFFRDNIQNVKI